MKNKIGAMFLVSVLALAGIGISYAGFTDVIHIYGTVDTATVSWEVIDYSGTDVWKVWNDDGSVDPWGSEVYRWEGYDQDQPTEADVLSTTGMQFAEPVASAWAKPDPDQEYDVLMDWVNIFPCQDFAVDIVIHYTGSIPAKINSADIWTVDYNPDIEGDQSAWLETLWNTPGAVMAEAYMFNIDTYEPIDELPVDVGTQIHTDDYIYVRLVIHLPQDNMLQDLYGEFGAYVDIVQWNEYPHTQ